MEVEESYYSIWETNDNTKEIFNKSNINDLIKRGVATPDHAIRTKAYPMLLSKT